MTPIERPDSRDRPEAPSHSAHSDGERVSAEFPQRVLDAVPGMLFVCDLERGRLEYVNDLLARTLGHPAEDLVVLQREALVGLIHPADLQRIRAVVRERRVQPRHVFGPFPIRVRAASGKWRWLEVSLAPLPGDPDPAVSRFIGAVHDLTRRRRTQRELARSRSILRDLNAHIEAARERERTRIARELHDELGQTLTSIKLELSWISGRLGEGAAPVRDRIGATGHQIDTAIQAVRRISSQLRPGLLDDLGLPAALNWQAREFEHTSGVRCHLSLRTGDAEPERDLATALFRIFQEALTNVARHAQARAVRASLVATRREWVLKITDDGRGIPAEAIRSATSLGLLGMQERVRRRGGRVEIQRVRPHGTRVEVRMPREA